MNYSIKSNGQTIGTFGTFLEALAEVERLVHEHAAKRPVGFSTAVTESSKENER